MKNTEQYNVELQYYSDEAFVLFELDRFDEVLISIGKIEKILNDRESLSFIQTQKQIKIVNLKSKTYFNLGYYQQAYNTQNKRLVLIKALRKREQISSIAEVRLALEVKQADLHTKLLENEQILQEIALLEAEKKQQQQRYYLLYIAVVALIFAWLFIKLIQDQRRLYKMLTIDALTGIANRRKTLKQGKLLFNRVKVQQRALSVLIIDIDSFKSINDQFGHDIGDVILKKMVQLCIKLLRKTDFMGRISGEEFMVLLPDTSHVDALIIAEHFRRSIAQYCCDKEDCSDKKISVSVGVTCTADFIEGELNGIETLINKANSLLSQAKAQGRNKVYG
jgi:diguanylate cyclase (GGDEF)-like protein